MERDTELIRRLLAGDEAAFERFFDAAYPALYRFALPRLNFDGEAAGEVAQSAICKAIRKLSTFRGEAALLTWVCTFCRHEVYAYRRQHDPRRRVELLEDDPEVRTALEILRAGDLEDPGSTIDRSRVASLVQSILDHLPDHYADALEWKYIEDASVAEIGDRLGIGRKAAESLLARARHAFREAFRALAPADASFRVT